ncbi:MAG: Holliday junction branch migration DNA helicase RuvB [Sulfobacillus sp.]
MDERVISAQASADERQTESALRPTTLAEYIGQAQAKAQLGIFIAAAKGRAETLDHVLVQGPPGLGKTTLAYVIAREMNTNIRVTSGPALERPADMASILTGLGAGDVLFIDEIHRLPQAAEEVLYPAMEDKAIDLVIGKGVGARTHRLHLEPMTVIGATTRPGLISAPLRDRFGINLRLDFYPPEELSQVIERSARILNVPLDPQAVPLLATRSRGTPRIANRILRRLRDVAQVEGDGQVTVDLAERGLRLIGIDQGGLDEIDRRYLRVLASKFRGGPAGVETLAAALSEETETVEDVVEPYLMQRGLIERTPRGRQLTPAGRLEAGMEQSTGGLFGP